jgi:hypothetical protein
VWGLIKKILIGRDRLNSVCINQLKNIKSKNFKYITSPVNRPINIKTISENIQQYIIILHNHSESIKDGEIISNPTNISGIKTINIVDFFIEEDAFIDNPESLIEEFKDAAIKFLIEYEKIKNKKTGPGGRNKLLASTLYNNLCSLISELKEVQQWKKIS